MTDRELQLPTDRPYAIPSPQRRERLLQQLNLLTRRHAEQCPAYRRILDAFDLSPAPAATLADIPYVPAQLFKRTLLRSVPESEVLRVLRSSGTGGQAPSLITLDRPTADRQTRTLGRIMADFLGPRRRPMLIVDQPLRPAAAGVSASGAAQLGFSPFGRDHFHLLKPDGSADLDGLRAWLAAHAEEPLLVFGMTAQVWEHLLDGPVAAQGMRCGRPSVLLHGGGWKKLARRSVAPADFKAAARLLNLNETRDYYGMAEQTGSIHVEDDDGPFVTPDSADILIRDPVSLAPMPDGETGLIQVFSTLPLSYPGHSILTEDLGRIVGVDDSPSGRRGTRFLVHGRLPASEIRGCSDTAQSPP